MPSLQRPESWTLPGLIFAPLALRIASVQVYRCWPGGGNSHSRPPRAPAPGQQPTPVGIDATELAAIVPLDFSDAPTPECSVPPDLGEDGAPADTSVRSPS